jgi:hypothetical protein
MNLGVRTILLLADENYADLLALGLAAFAGAFLSDAMGWADRTFSTSDRRDTT